MHKLLVIVALGALTLGACSDSESSEPQACQTPAPGGDLSLLPDDLPFESLGTVTIVQVRRGFLGAELFTDGKIVELHPEISRAVMASGYKILAADNEGFESEIFFGRGRKTNGAYRLRIGPCEGMTTIKLLYGSPKYRGLG